MTIVLSIVAAAERGERREQARKRVRARERDLSISSPSMQGPVPWGHRQRRVESDGEGGRSGGRKAVVQGGVPRMRPLRLRVVVVRRLRFFVVLVFSPFGVACAVNVVLLSGM